MAIMKARCTSAPVRSRSRPGAYDGKYIDADPGLLFAWLVTVGVHVDSESVFHAGRLEKPNPRIDRADLARRGEEPNFLLAEMGP